MLTPVVTQIQRSGPSPHAKTLTAVQLHGIRRHRSVTTTRVAACAPMRQRSATLTRTAARGAW
jgi:hypothetical protein